MDERVEIVATRLAEEDRRLVFQLVMVACAVRVLILLLADPLAQLGNGDDAFYLAAARNLIFGSSYAIDGAPTDFRPPAYPMFVALLGADAATAFAAQLLIGVAVSILTFFTLARCDRALAKIVAFAVAAVPFFPIYELKVASEPLYIPLVWTAWLLLFVRRRRRWPFIAGVLLGIALLARDTLLLLPLAALPFAWGERVLLRRVAIAAGIAYLVLLPWPLRNMAIPNGGFEVSAGRFGYNLWVGTWERDPRWLDAGIARANYPAAAFRSPAERSALLRAYARGDDAAFKRVAIDRIRTEPLRNAATWLIRYPRLWLGTRSDQIAFRIPRSGAAWYAIKIALFAANLALLAAGIAGMILTRREPWRFFAAPIVYVALVYVPFHNTEPRYSLIAVPFLCLFAAIAGQRAYTSWRARLGRTQTAIAPG